MAPTLPSGLSPCHGHHSTSRAGLFRVRYAVERQRGCVRAHCHWRGASTARRLRARRRSAGSRRCSWSAATSAAGTSSASSRLIHGGAAVPRALRALARARVVARARAVLQARRIWSSRSSCVFRSIAVRGAGGCRSASGLRSTSGCLREVGAGAAVVLARRAARAHAGLQRDGLVGGASYYDAQVRYPERLVVENVRDAVANGAVLSRHARYARASSKAVAPPASSAAIRGAAPGGARRR